MQTGFICSACLSLALIAQTGPEATIRVRIYDQAHLDRQTIERAQRQVSFIFEKIGVRLEWLTEGEPPLRILLVEQLPPEIRSSEEVFGYTPKDPDGTSSGLAYVAYAPVKAFVQKPEPGRPRLNVSDMLGYAIAHEIGHLLLPAGSHSPAGVMRARWRAKDFELISTGTLLFTSQQGERIRDTVRRLPQAR